MKNCLLIFGSFLFVTISIFSKTRQGEYYLGFGYATAESDKGLGIEGDFINLSVNSPASDSADFVLNFNYGSVNESSSDSTSWNLGLDYVFHYDDYIHEDGLFRPFVGIGLNYLDDGAKIRLNDDGFAYKFLVGTEVLFTDSFSLSLGGDFTGLLSDFSDNYITLNVGVTWWINEIHGAAVEFNHALENEINFIGLKYLYSWK